MADALTMSSSVAEQMDEHTAHGSSAPILSKTTWLELFLGKKKYCEYTRKILVISAITDLISHFLTTKCVSTLVTSRSNKNYFSL